MRLKLKIVGSSPTWGFHGLVAHPSCVSMKGMLVGSSSLRCEAPKVSYRSSSSVVEHLSYEQRVVGSIPTWTKYSKESWVQPSAQQMDAGFSQSIPTWTIFHYFISIEK